MQRLFTEWARYLTSLPFLPSLIDWIQQVTLYKNLTELASLEFNFLLLFFINSLIILPFQEDQNFFHISLALLLSESSSSTILPKKLINELTEYICVQFFLKLPFHRSMFLQQWKVIFIVMVHSCNTEIKHLLAVKS